MSAPAIVHVVPHTHWDREWYEPFEVYRFWLVRTVDALRATLRDDAAFRHFNFDGQTAAIEDYLEIRPEAEAEIAAFVRDGRLAVGPWRILMDEFLCSGETIVRNLRQGNATATRLGRSMRLGYIPDSFGHISQMPQLLRLAGLSDACVWRGVPSAVDRTAFDWEAPDGSRVRTLYLATSYSNAASLPHTFEDLMVRAKRIVADLAPFRPDGAVLAMNGTDHRAPDPDLPAAVAEANARQDELELRIGSMEEYLAVAPRDGLPLWRGEMRSGARANLLMGVASARMELKQAELRASTLLERYAEPLSALAGRDFDRLLDRAWRWMVENSAHDSVNGCGVDDTAEQVLARYRDAARIATMIAADGLETLAAAADTTAAGDGDGALVWNPLPRTRDLIAEVSLPKAGATPRLADAAGRPLAVQVVESSRETVVDMALTGEQLGRIVPTIHSRTIGPHVINAIAVDDAADPVVVRLDLGHVAEGALDVEAGKRAVEGLIASRPGATFRVVGETAATARALVAVPGVPGLGTSLVVGDRQERVPEAPAHPATAAGRTLGNGLVTATVREDGTVDLVHTETGMTLEGALALEDGGDAGDEYNYSPPVRDRIVGEPAGPASVEVLEDGPLRATIRVTTERAIPASLAAGDEARAERTVPLRMQMDLSVLAGEPLLRASMRWVNEARDHRLRVLVPLPFSTRWSDADQSFDVVRRSIEAEGGPHERALATYPCRRWVDASDGARGVAVVHRGTPEYELVEGRTVAITLQRSVGWLSRQRMLARGGPAGPMLQTPAAQGLGERTAEIALYPHAGDWRAASVHDVAEAYLYEPLATPVRAHEGGALPAGLSVAPASVQLSAFHRDGEGLACRVWNASADAVEASIAVAGSAVSAERTDLFGGALAPCTVRDGTIAVSLGPWEIATIRIA